MKPRQLKIRRTNSIFGSWACEEHNSFTDIIGMGKDIQEAINDYIQSFKKFHGFTPDYKWS